MTEEVALEKFDRQTIQVKDLFFEGQKPVWIYDKLAIGYFFKEKAWFVIDVEMGQTILTEYGISFLEVDSAAEYVLEISSLGDWKAIDVEELIKLANKYPGSLAKKGELGGIDISKLQETLMSLKSI